MRAVCGFQTFCGFNQNTIPGTSTSSHHNGSRCCQAQCTRAGNHQNGYSSLECHRKRMPGHQPTNQSKQRNADDCRNKHTADAVRKLGNRRFGTACFFDQTDNLRQCGIFSHFCGTVLEVAGSADRCTQHRIPNAFFHRNGFSGQSRFIYCAASCQQNTIHRNGTSSTNDYDISRLYRFGWNLLFHAISKHRCLFGCQIDQCCNGIRRFCFGTRLHKFSKCNQRQNHAGRFKIQLIHILMCGIHVAMSHVICHGENSIHAVQEGGRRTKRN